MTHRFRRDRRTNSKPATTSSPTHAVLTATNTGPSNGKLSGNAALGYDARVARSERSHAGEVRLAVEASMSPLEVLRGRTTRDRAQELFSLLRVWDTEDNTGVLVYLQMVDHRIEIVADRGISRRVPQSEWDAICRRMEAAADSPYLAATDLAEWLVERGTPFRDAHALVGSLVRDSLERNVAASSVGISPRESGSSLWCTAFWPSMSCLIWGDSSSLATARLSHCVSPPSAEYSQQHCSSSAAAAQDGSPWPIAPPVGMELILSRGGIGGRADHLAEQLAARRVLRCCGCGEKECEERSDQRALQAFEARPTPRRVHWQRTIRMRCAIDAPCVVNSPDALSSRTPQHRGFFRTGLRQAPQQAAAVRDLRIYAHRFEGLPRRGLHRGIHGLAEIALEDGTELMSLSLSVAWEMPNGDLAPHTFSVAESLDAYYALIAVVSFTLGRRLISKVGIVHIEAVEHDAGLALRKTVAVRAVPSHGGAVLLGQFFPRGRAAHERRSCARSPCGRWSASPPRRR